MHSVDACDQDGQRAEFLGAHMSLGILAQAGVLFAVVDQFLSLDPAAYRFLGALSISEKPCRCGMLCSLAPCAGVTFLSSNVRRAKT